MLPHLSTAVEIAAQNVPLSLIAITDIAAALRRSAGQDEPAFSTRAIVGTCFPDVLVTGATLPPGVYGALSHAPDGGAVILYARGQPAAVQRHAIAHELAHFIFDGVEAHRRPGEPADPVAEWRADFFADELLVPLAELRPYVGRWPSGDGDYDFYLDMVDEIASHFGVLAPVADRQIRSLECALIRLGERKFTKS